MNIITFLAIWGSVISTSLLCWTIYRDLSAKGKIKVSCFIGNEFGGLSNPEKDLLVYKITNVSKKSIYINLIGGAFTKKQFLLSSKQLPKILQPGEHIVESTEDLSIFEKDLKNLWVIDSLDNYWKISKKNMESLFDTYKQGRAK